MWGYQMGPQPSYILPYLINEPCFKLTIYMKHILSWEGTTSSASQENNHGLRRFITAFTNAHHPSLPCARITKSTPPPSHYLKIHFNIILHPHQGLASCSFLQVSPPPVSHTCHMPEPSHSSRFDYSNIWWGVKIMKLLVRQSFFFYSLLQSEMFFVNEKLITHYSRLMLLIKI